MKKISTIIFTLLITFNFTFSQSSHIINTTGMSFDPDTTICNIGDTIIFNLGGYHNAVEVSSATWIGNGTSSNGGFSFPLGTPTATIIIDSIKTYYYVCTPHVTMGMKAVIISNYIDCNDIVNGSSIMDSCGVCQQSYIYNYVTHAVTILNDTMNITLGATEMLVMANDPQNPYWNSSFVASYDTISSSTSILWNGLYIGESGNYSDSTLVTTSGCDSIAYLNFTFIGVNSIETIQNDSSLLKITNLLGEEANIKKNQILLFIYENGIIEKRIIME